jgi:glycosyltransferase involved in cell wall biosynthesis
MKILYLINHRPFFVSHRLPIALNMKSNGHEVHLLTGKSNDKNMEKYAAKQLKKNDIKSNVLDFNSANTNLFESIKTLSKTYKFIKKLDPDLIHTASMKAIILSGLCCLLIKKPIVIAFSGFGYIFTESKNLKTQSLKFIIEFLLKIIFINKKKHIIVQNKFDFNYLFKNFNLNKKDISILNGSGVILNNVKNNIKKNNIVLFPSRILIHKGIIEFIEAAKFLKKKYDNWKFLAVGSYEGDNPTNLDLKYLKQVEKNNIVSFLNYTPKINYFFNKSKIVCLPTYREGTPKSLIDACALGLPIVTTKIPGCHLVVKSGYNGYKVPVKNINSLINKLEILIKSQTIRKKFSKNSFLIAKKYFDIKIIIAKHSKIYQKVFNEK